MQDPAEAIFSDMPTSAVENAPVDHILPVARMPQVLARLANNRIEKGTAAMPSGNHNHDTAVAGDHALEDHTMPSPPPGSPAQTAAGHCGRSWTESCPAIIATSATATPPTD